MDFGGIIAGALGGAARQTGELADNAIQMDNRATLQQQESEIALARAKALEDYKTQSGNRQRSERADRINTGAAGIVARQQADRLNNFYNKGGDGTVTALNPEDISDEEKAMVPTSESDLSQARIKAASQSGDLDPNQEAAISGRQAALEAANDRMAVRLESQQQISQDRILSSERNTDVRVQAAIDKAMAGSNKDAKKDRLTTIINSMNATIKNLTEGERGKTPEAKAAWKKSLDDAIALRDGATAQLKTSMLDVQPTPKPASAAPSASGSRKDVADALKAWEDQGR